MKPNHLCVFCFILRQLKTKTKCISNLPTDHNDTDGFIRPEVQYPEKDSTRIVALQRRCTRRRRRSQDPKEKAGNENRSGLNTRGWLLALELHQRPRVWKQDQSIDRDKSDLTRFRSLVRLKSLTSKGFNHWLDLEKDLLKHGLSKVRGNPGRFFLKTRHLVISRHETI